MASGGEIKRLRLLDGKKSAAIVASYIGVDAEKMRKWESKNVDPVDTADIEKIETYFGKPLDELFNLETFQFKKRENKPEINNVHEKYIALLEKTLHEKEQEVSSLREGMQEVTTRLNGVIQKQTVTYANLLANQAEILKWMARSDRKDEKAYIISGHKNFLGSLEIFETEGIHAGINKLNNL